MPDVEPSSESSPLPSAPSELSVSSGRVRLVEQTLAELSRTNLGIAQARKARKGALRASKQARQAVSLEYALFEHRDHPTFHRFDNPWKREVCFGCDCAGRKLRKHIPLTTLKQSPRLIQAFRELRPRPGPLSCWISSPKPKPDLAEKRAQALLHQFLTREQRWSLRASRSFVVTGQDGRMYEVTEDQGVRLLVNGRAVTSYCIHPREALPRGDVMLAQKLLLESNIDHFLSTANARELLLTGT